MRQYAAFEYIQDILRGHLKANTIISELKSDALKERHWQKLFKVLRVSRDTNLTRLTLGQVYDLDLKRNETLIKDVIIQAQGEVRTRSNYVGGYLTRTSDGSGGILEAGPRNLDKLHIGPCQLPEQVSLDQVRFTGEGRSRID